MAMAVSGSMTGRIGEMMGLFESCANCDANFDRGVKYPALIEQGEDGDVSLHSFCCDACKADWVDDLD